MEKSGSKPRRQRKKKPAENVDKGPRDTKVVLVNPSLFLTLKPENPTSSKASHSSQAFNHFPVLGSGGEEFPDHALNSPWCMRVPKDPFPKLGEQFDDQKSADELKESKTTCKIIEARGSNCQPDVTADSKLKRSKKAISLDLTSIIKAKNKLQHKASRSTLKRRKFHRNDTLSGNILDSSMPIRKRGKVREIERIKLSPLKTAIIKDRIIKAMRNTSVHGEEISLSEIDFKKEVENYLARKRKSKTELDSTREVSDAKQSNLILGTKKNKIFNQKFRSYCENVVTPELNTAVKQLIQHLVSLQDHAFYRDPVRARARKRFVVGFREAAKYLKLKSVKLLILAPDLETSASDGAINNVIRDLKTQATVDDVPFVFALDRRKLGYCSLRKVPVSAFAVLNFEGLETLFQATLEEYQKTRNEFLEKITEDEETTVATTDSNSITQLLSKLTVNTPEN